MPFTVNHIMLKPGYGDSSRGLLCVPWSWFKDLPFQGELFIGLLHVFYPYTTRQIIPSAWGRRSSDLAGRDFDVK